MKNISKLVWMVVLTTCLGAASPAYADAKLFNWGKKKASTQDTVKKKSEYEKFLEPKHETVQGLITMHKMKSKLYFELPVALLQRDMLLGSTVSEISNNYNAIIGSKPMEPLHFRFTKVDQNVCMNLVVNNNIYNPGDSTLARAVSMSNIDPIIKSFKITTYNKDSTALVFEVTDLFVGDDKRMSPFDPYSANVGGSNKRTEIFNRDKSFVGEIKAFNDNVVVRSTLSYDYSISGKTASVKDVPFTAVMTRSIVLLDESPYRERLTDSRIAIFPTEKYKYSGADQYIKTLYYANRWRLEPSDVDAYKRGECVTPKKPIVFYVDSNFPDKWKPYIKEGVDQWRELFETIGFKDAIRAEYFPVDDPQFDPDNIKYSCIRYAPIPIANAMGPSWLDPRSGEIINASVYVYHDVIELLNNWLFIQTAQADKRVRHVTVPDSVIGDGLRYVISHEIGHCLGFMHNMGASSVFPVDSLRSPSFTQKYGTTPSIMDYARFNYVAQPGDMERGVRLTPPRFGEYERFLIKWNYTYLPEIATAEQEYKLTSSWINESYKNPLLHFGKQQFEMFDPSAQSEDLGDNSVKASQYGIKNLKYILANLNKWVDAEDDDYTYRGAIYNGIIGQYFQYMIHVYANVGGLYMNEKHVADDTFLYRSVPSKIQKEALYFLLDQVADLDWIDNADVMRNLTIMGSPADVLREEIIKAIISSPAKVDFSAAKAEKDPYTVEMCMNDIYKYVWKPTLEGKKLTDAQIKMQNLFVKFIAAGAGVKLDRESAKALTNIELPRSLACNDGASSGLCSHPACRHAAGGYGFNPVAGYDDPMVNYHVPANYDAMYFGYIKRVQELLRKCQNTPDYETRMHYKLMLHKIDNSLK